MEAALSHRSKRLRFRRSRPRKAWEEPKLSGRNSNVILLPESLRQGARENTLLSHVHNNSRNAEERFGKPEQRFDQPQKLLD